MTRLHVPVPVRWSDLDAYEHVNNARMLTLLEEARIAAFWSDPAGGAPTAVLETGPGAPSITLVAGQRIREPLDVELWIGRLGGASLEVCYEIYTPPGVEPRTLYTRAATTIAAIETTANAIRNPVKISPAGRMNPAKS